MKNADINIVPHPFTLEQGEQVVMLDPVETLELCELMECGERPSNFLFNDYIRLDNSPIQRVAPMGVQTVKFKWKNTQLRADEAIRDRKMV